jgi:hydroxymethylglutaryl-CoA synthase
MTPIFGFRILPALHLQIMPSGLRPKPGPLDPDKGRRRIVIGITSFGVCVPPYRLARDEISRAWKTRSLGGEKAVAGHDEDSLTMAVGAVLECMKNRNHKPDGLFFASTTSPYKEKQAAAIIAAAVDLPEETRTADFADSLRSGTIALASAVDAVKSGSAERVIVAVSDARMGAGKSQFEQLFGDAAVALEIGSSEVIAGVEGSYSVFSELMDVWRLEGSSFVQSWEERFILSEGYEKMMQKAVAGLMEKHKLSPKDFSRVVFNGPDGRSHARLAKRFGFDLHTQVQDPLFESVGNAGTAALPLMLVHALCQAEPQDRILVASYGDGADAFILGVTEGVENLKERAKMKEVLAKKIFIDYEKYLQWRDLVPSEEPHRPDPRPPSIPCLWRERRSALSFYGSKCRQCGAVQYPPQRICAKCQAEDDSVAHKLSDRKGTIFTYSIDYLTPSKEVPAIIGVVDFEGGGRLMCELTGCEISNVRIGMPVEMCFRKLDRKGGIHSYFWKARPA